MKINKRFIYILFGIFISVEMAIIILALGLGYIFFQDCNRLGFKLIEYKEFLRWLIALPIAALVFASTKAREIWLPKNEKFPQSILDWEHSKSIRDFVIITAGWALLNAAITCPLCFIPTLIHSGRLFIILTASSVLALYQLMNIFIEEMRARDFCEPTK